jgi:two-component system, cell cycle response regulator
VTRVSTRRSVLYAAAGAVLSFGAPLGLLLLRELYVPRPIAAELFADRLTYLYVFLSTAAVLTSLGFALGRQTDRLAALSETDALTGLPNRRALRRRVTEEFSRSIRYGSPISLLIVDVDGLKQVNDTHGHPAGDKVIRKVADAIGSTLRQSDFGARWGGDEFAILAPNASAAAARGSAERLLAQVGERLREEGPYRSGVSIGVATFDPSRDEEMDLEALVHAADQALYAAKANGRNRVHAAEL